MFLQLLTELLCIGSSRTVVFVVKVVLFPSLEFQLETLVIFFFLKEYKLQPKTSQDNTHTLHKQESLVLHLFKSNNCPLSSSGLEHHVCQLVNVCLPHLVLHSVDGEGPETLRHVVLSLHGGLRQPADCSAVHLEF